MAAAAAAAKGSNGDGESPQLLRVESKGGVDLVTEVDKVGLVCVCVCVFKCVCVCVRERGP